jgi:hypothetical protein
VSLTSPLFIAKEYGSKESPVHLWDRLARRVEQDHIGITVDVIDQKSALRGRRLGVSYPHVCTVDLFNGIIPVDPLEGHLEVGPIYVYSECREPVIRNVFLVVEAHFPPVFIKGREARIVRGLKRSGWGLNYRRLSLRLGR